MIFFVLNDLFPSSKNIFDSIHNGQVACLVGETIGCPSVFIHANIFHLLLNFVKWWSNPLHHHIKPLFDKLATFDSCYEITLQGQLPLSSNFIYLIPFPINWIAVIGIPKHKNLRLVTVSIPNEIFWKLCHFGNPVERFIHHESGSIEIDSTVFIYKGESPKIWNGLTAKIKSCIFYRILNFLQKLTWNEVLYAILRNSLDSKSTVLSTSFEVLIAKLYNQITVALNAVVPNYPNIFI